MLKIFDFSFFFNDTATTEIYTLSLHDALPIWEVASCTNQRTGEASPYCVLEGHVSGTERDSYLCGPAPEEPQDRKSTRLNSSHANISYAVFCLKKKKTYTLFQSTCLARDQTHS